MRHYFMRKYIFAAVFLVSLGAFSLWNIYSCRDALLELGGKFLDIRSFDDLKGWIADVDEDSVDEIAWKMNFIEVYGYVNKILGKNEMEDFRYVRDIDGQVNYGTTYPVIDDTWDYAVRVRKLKDYAENNGMKVLFVSPPSKVLHGVSHLEKDSLVNDKNPVQDQFLWQLQQNRVPALDLRKPLQNTGLSSTELFFKSDHHWTPKAAFVATEALVDEIRQRYGDDWDPEGFYCDIDNYNQKTYRGIECGSIAQNAGIVYAGTDDFTLIWPSFETSFSWKTVTQRGEEEEYKGDITETLLRLDRLTNEDPYDSDPYGVYLNTISRQDEIVNLSNPDGPSLLVLRDSYFAPMACFLAPMCSRIDMVWSNGKDSKVDFGEYLKEKIESGTFDYLLIEIYPYSLYLDNSFPFFTEPGKEEP